MADLDLGHLFATCRTAWRLATLDEYVVDEEAGIIDAWVRDGTISPRQDGWLELLEAGHRRGATFGRVQILNRPLTDYASYLLSVAYPENTAAGEDIRLAVRQDHRDGLAELADDFWIFDRTTVAVMDYDDDGRFRGFWDDSRHLTQYVANQRLALRVSQPIGQANVA